MNEFMWFIYLADLLPSVGAFAVGMGIFLTIVSVILIIVAAAYWSDHDPFTEREAKTHKSLKKMAYTFSFFSLLLLFVGAIIPSKQTIYTMAAAKAGEQLARTDIAAKAKQAIEMTLDNVIKKYIPKPEEPKKSN